MGMPALAIFKAPDHSYAASILEVHQGKDSTEGHFMTLEPTEAQQSDPGSLSTIADAHLFHSSTTTAISQQITVFELVKTRLEMNGDGALVWEWRGEDMLSLLEALLLQVKELHLQIPALEAKKMQRLNLPHKFPDGFKLSVVLPGTAADGIAAGPAQVDKESSISCTVQGCSHQLRQADDSELPAAHCATHPQR
jgi:hypothetical protein